MEASSAQHKQEMGAHVVDNMLVCTKAQQQQQQERKPRPNPEESLKCPRCDSTNTKFCYYNNYSLSQPRYFCKSCRRYWTKGGTLRNVPVGGGCRKNKRSSSSKIIRTSQDNHHHQLATAPSNNSLTALQDHLANYDSNDLTLAFARLQNQSSNGQLVLDHHNQQLELSIHGNYPTNRNSEFIANPNIPNFDALRTGFLDTQNPNFQSMYYGYGNGIGEVESSGVFMGGDQMVIPYNEEMSSSTANGATTQAVTVATMKQELVCNSERDEDHESINYSKVLWGYPWQFNGNGNTGNEGNYDHLDSARESWINGLGSTWHGLLNSPLM